MKTKTLDYLRRWLEDKAVEDFTKQYVIDIDGSVKQLDLKLKDDEFEGAYPDYKDVIKAIGSDMMDLVSYIEPGKHTQKLVMYVDGEGLYTQPINVPMSEFYYWLMVLEHGKSNINKDFTYLFGPVFVYFPDPVATHHSLYKESYAS